MKKALATWALALLCFNISHAQYQSFLSGFSPDNSHYQGICGNQNPHYQLDTLYWNQWIDQSSQSGTSWQVLHQYRYAFAYLPNGKIHQIQQYVIDNSTTWNPVFRYTYEYDEQDRMTSYTVGSQWSDGHWQFYNIFDFTYDEFDRVITNHITSWNGVGYADSHSEFRYEYDDEGRLICESYFIFNVNYSYDMYFNRWLYNYKNGKLANKCYQRYYLDTGWLNYDMYLYSYYENEVSAVLHQTSTSDSLWHNNEKQLYEYGDDGETTFITTQTWTVNDEWVNKSRTTKTYNENGTLTQELYQAWQNEEWVDKRRCDYTLDNYGNCTEGHWKDYVDGEWIDSESNNTLFVQYNEGASILSESVQNYQAKYSYQFSSINESLSHQAEAFPNPGTDQLTIQTNAPFTEVIVYDLLGRQVFSQAISETTIHINTENWPFGVYFWKTYNSSSSQCGKWVKN